MDYERFFWGYWRVVVYISYEFIVRLVFVYDLIWLLVWVLREVCKWVFVLLYNDRKDVGSGFEECVEWLFGYFCWGCIFVFYIS